MKLTNRRLFSWMVAIAMVLSMLPGFVLAVEGEFSGGGSGTEESPYEIATAAQLDEVRNDLAAHYILTEDIDLSEYDNWAPIGAFAPASEEDAETPQANVAFSGSFDGNNHTTSGLTIAEDDGFAAGLFGCISGAKIKDLVITGANVTGNMMVAAGIGYAYDSTVDNLDLIGANTIAGKNVEDGYPNNMMAGTMGAAMDCTINNCDIIEDSDGETVITVEAGAENVGLIGGGLEGGVITSCTVSGGAIVAGENSIGIGGLAGCTMEFDEVSGCAVTGVTLTVGDGAYLVGGLTGFTGKADENMTAVSDCATDVVILVGENANRVGGLIGGGFFVPGYEAYYPVPTSFEVSGCTTSGSITTGSGSDAIGTILGNAYLSPLSACSTTLTINGSADSLSVGSDAQLDALTGTYQQLFEGAIFNDAYTHYWHDYCAAIAGEDQADAYVDMLKSTIGGPVSVIGGDGSEGQFNCAFYDKDNTGIALFTIDGTQISGYTADGTEIFSHIYQFVETDALYSDGVAVMHGFSLFETEDANAGEFKYFYFAPDTPESTFHIEFRYGSDLTDLKQMRTGIYGYWLAAGILTDAMEDPDETMLEQVIALFCLENMDYSEERTDASLAQISDLVGIWDCNVEDYPEFAALGIDGLYCVLQADGIGTTFARIAGGDYFVTGTYDFFAYDNSSNDASGIYVAHSEEEGAAASHYVLSDNGRTLSFETLGGEAITYTRRSFIDVDPAAYYSAAVDWAVEQGVTNGTSATTFSPDASCTRGQVVTFLWRAMGSPEPTSTSTSFTDIDSSSYYYTAVIWATEQGITKGTSDTTFGPEETVTRAEAVTFQWRAANVPAADGTNPFVDVPSDTYYSVAVLWAVNEGVTTGTSSTTFDPNGACTRAQIVTFLYRQLGA